MELRRAVLHTMPRTVIDWQLATDEKLTSLFKHDTSGVLGLSAFQS